MENTPLYVLIGAMVETSVAEKFKEKLGNINTTDAVGMFVELVAEGKLKLEEK